MESPFSRQQRLLQKSCVLCSEFSSSKHRASELFNYHDIQRNKKENNKVLPAVNILYTTSMVSYGAEAYQELQVGRWVEGVFPRFNWSPDGEEDLSWRVAWVVD